MARSSAFTKFFRLRRKATFVPSSTPTGETVGLGPYVAAFCDFLRRQNDSDQTDPARTISIEGGWGSGKSTFVEQTIERLRAQDVPVVEFKPWLHHNVDELWITLAEAVHRDIRGQLNRRQYFWRMGTLWFRQQFRWGYDKKDHVKITSVFLAAAIVVMFFLTPLLMQLVYERVVQHDLSDDVMLFASVFGGVAAAIPAGAGLISALTRKKAAVPTSRIPPLVHRLETEFADLINVLCPPGKWTDRAVIFVDDLDRCSAIGVSETFRALSALVNNDKLNATIVLAIDRDRVAAALAADDERLTPFHVTNGGPNGDDDGHERAVRLGHLFLEKFINVTMRIPAVGLNHVPRILRREEPKPYLDRDDLSGRSGTAMKDAENAVKQLDSEFVFLADDYLQGNPRRIWLWRREIELRVLTLSHLGRYDRSVEPTCDCVSLEQLARFELLAILWPRFIGDLRRHPSLVKWLTAYEITAGQPVALPPEWNIPSLPSNDAARKPFEYWARRHRDETLTGLLSREDTETLTATSQPPVMARLNPALLLIMQDVFSLPCGQDPDTPPASAADAAETPPASPEGDNSPTEQPPIAPIDGPVETPQAETAPDEKPTTPLAPLAEIQEEPPRQDDAKFYDAELRAAHAAVETARQRSGSDSARYADALNRLQHVLWNLGRYSEAEKYATASLEVRRHLFEGDHPDVAQSLNNLASVKRALGRPDEAEQIQQQALNMRRRLFGGDHPDVASSLNNFAGIKEALGQASEAEAIYQQALDMTRRIYDGDHPDVAQSLNNLASVRQTLGQASEAEAIYQQALDMTRRMYDGDHPRVAASLNNLASVKQARAQASEAETIYQNTLDMLRRIYEGDHPDVASTLSNLATVKKALGRADEAERIHQDALDMRRRIFEGDHPDIAISLHNLASVREALGRHAEAESLYQSALDMRRRLYRGDHPNLAASLNNLASVLVSLGKMHEALEPATEAVEMARRCLPEGHPHREAYERNLAALQKRLEGDDGLS